ncbi:MULTISPECIES: hypothetical protein [unclassified Rhizobium]|uniref:hypothetical protein n=1 Tax=unclassified Rhizobium TaxID=2613769 RepID=UPI0013C4C025|nr:MULTISPECIES: hypothetical protein [unclassified Rhizobium]
MVAIALIIGRPVDNYLFSGRGQSSADGDGGRTGNNCLSHLRILLNFPDDQLPKWNNVPASWPERPALYDRSFTSLQALPPSLGSDQGVVAEHLN